ncbi:MAG TPA: hypothetical protein VJN18_14955 [Polyangiaceae bacterium]|nr:hypothetical protein [Polyangiaceae bacterium]
MTTKSSWSRNATLDQVLASPESLTKTSQGTTKLLEVAGLGTHVGPSAETGGSQGASASASLFAFPSAMDPRDLQLRNLASIKPTDEQFSVKTGSPNSTLPQYTASGADFTSGPAKDLYAAAPDSHLPDYAALLANHQGGTSMPGAVRQLAPSSQGSTPSNFSKYEQFLAPQDGFSGLRGGRGIVGTTIDKGPLGSAVGSPLTGSGAATLPGGPNLSLRKFDASDLVRVKDALGNSGLAMLGLPGPKKLMQGGVFDTRQPGVPPKANPAFKPSGVVRGQDSLNALAKGGGLVTPPSLSPLLDRLATKPRRAQDSIGDLSGRSPVLASDQLADALLIEKQLLEILVKTARELEVKYAPAPGEIRFDPDDPIWELPNWKIWEEAWTRRLELGDVSRATVPEPRLARAIIDTARQTLGSPSLQAALTAPGPISPAQVLKRAVAWVKLQEQFANLQEAFDDLNPFATASDAEETDEDPYAIDLDLVTELMRQSVDQPIPDIFARAWQARSKYDPWPIATPSRAMVAAIIAANQTAAGGRSRLAVVNKARATVLFRLLGSSLIRTNGGRIEPVLRDLIVQIALPLRPSNWDDIVNRLEQQRGYVPSNQLDPLFDAINQANIPGVPELPLQVRYELESALEAVVDDVWDEALYRRDQLWALPWPPQPRPSRKFLQSLIAAVWTYSDNLVAEENEAFVELAFIQLHGAPGLGKVQQALVLEVTATGLAIGTLAAIVIGTGIGLTYCIFTNCFGLRDGLIRAFSSSGEDDPTPMPAPRPVGGTGSATPTNFYGSRPSTVRADPCGPTAAQAICGTSAQRAARATAESQTADNLARALWDQASPTLVGAVSDADVEHAVAIIRRKDGSLRYGAITTSNQSDFVAFDQSRNAGEQIVGMVHTHPSNGTEFTNHDTWWARNERQKKNPQFKYHYILIRPPPGEKGAKPRLRIFEPKIGGDRGTITDVP